MKDFDPPDGADPSLLGFVRELVRVNHHHNCLLCHAFHDSKHPWQPAAAPRIARAP